MTNTQSSHSAMTSLEAQLPSSNIRVPNLNSDPVNEAAATVANGIYQTDGNLTTPSEVAGVTEIVIFSAIFFVVGLVGIVGNVLVVYVVVCDKKMRSSITNLLISNLALADLIIMMLGVPEIVQFMMNKGWVLNLLLCKTNRFVLVVALYASVMTLVSICVERYIGVVHPMRAHILCSRARVARVVSIIWPLALVAGTPTLLFNEMQNSDTDVKVKFCHLHFPHKPLTYYLVFKYTELAVFYILPLLVQVVLYAQVSRQLFHGSSKLRRDVTARSVHAGAASLPSLSEVTRRLIHYPRVGKGECRSPQFISLHGSFNRESASDALQARRGVLKMLMLSVLVYLLSYSPLHALLVYTTFWPDQFHGTWTLNVLVSILAYMNSAANPVLYSIFSQNFRLSFRAVLCRLPRQPPLPRCQFYRKATFSTSGRFPRAASLIQSGQSEL